MPLLYSHPPRGGHFCTAHFWISYSVFYGAASSSPGPGAAPAIGVRLTYNRRGLPATATATVAGTAHPIVTRIDYLRDGLVGAVVYGDTDAGGATARAPTRSATTYDIRRRPVRMTTTRRPDPMAAAQTLGAVGTVVDQRLVWDAANNLTAVIDHRDPYEWPDGHLPQTVHVRHDALYRVIGAEYDYTQRTGRMAPSDLGTDWRSEFGESATRDPMRQEPPDMVSTRPPSRVNSLTWSWDYLANTTAWSDDESSFYERSLGDITNGAADGRRPSAVYLATNLSGGVGSGAGWLEVAYGEGGNLTEMTVHGQCVDGPSACVDPGGSLSSRRSALRAHCACSSEQHYRYRWDELERLSEARRYDRDASTGGRWQRRVRQRYRYDGANSRVVEQTLDETGCGAGSGAVSCERVALYPYSGDFERRGLARGFRGYVPAAGVDPETQYVIAGARTVFRTGGDAGAGFDREQRLVVSVADLIQTTSAAFDVRTGRLLESSTYYPNGARETFLNDDDALVGAEPMGFTGKEADEEVGVVYFGERYLVPRLGRWASPDPLHVHAVGGGEALNSYHYVSGNLLAARDPLGLDYHTPADQNSSYVETTCAANTSCGAGGAVTTPASPSSPPAQRGRRSRRRRHSTRAERAAFACRLAAASSFVAAELRLS